MTQDILITPGSGEPQILFRGSGTNDTPIELNVLSSYQSATGSGTALIFEGQEGQLFAVTDNLSSGTIFSVGDITGLSMLSVDASGDVKLGEFANSVIVYPGLTLDDNVPSTTTNVLYNDGGDLMWNGVTVIQSGAAQAVDGSGTASYVARFTDTNTLGTGIIYDNGTNVGIGTASPGQKLHISTTGHTELQIDAGVDSNPGVRLTNDAQNWVMRLAGDSSDQFQIRQITGTPSNRLIIDTSGKVGIGADSPTQKLDIRYPASGGMALLKATDTTDGLLFGDVYTASNDFQGIKHVGMTGNNDYMMISAGGDTFISAKSASALYLRAGGNDPNSEIKLTSTEVVVNDYSSNRDFRVESNNDANALFVDGVSDYVGIGTGSPSYKLDVLGNINTSGNFYSLGAPNTSSSLLFTSTYSNNNVVAMILANRSANWGATLKTTVWRTGGGFGGQNASVIGVLDDITGYPNQNTHTSFNTTSSTQFNNAVIYIGSGNYVGNTRPSLYTEQGAVFAATGGNVGIGTTSPTSPLHVLETGGSTSGVNTALILDYESDTTTVAGGGTAIEFRGKSSGGNLANWQQARIRSVGYVGNNSHGIAFDTRISASYGLEEAVRISNNGYVGIATTTPTYKLHIGGTSPHMLVNGGFSSTARSDHGRIYLNNTNYGMGVGRFNSSGNEDLYIWAYNGTGRHIRFCSTTNGNTDTTDAIWNTNVIIKNDGNVGIGTASPTHKLHIKGGVNSSTDSYSQLTIESDGTYPDTMAGISLNSPSSHQSHIRFLNNGTAKFQIRYNSGNTTEDKLKIYSWTQSTDMVTFDGATGRVGIGTTSPSSKLHIVQNTASNVLLKLEQDNASYESYYEATSQDGGYSRFGIGSNANDYTFFNSDQSSYRWYTASTPLMTLLTSNGNLGIGTTSPQQKLHVVGDQRIENATDPKLEFHDGAAVGAYVKFDTSEDNLVLSHVDVAGDNQIALANDGNVGIGTASPNAVLHAYGSTPSGTVFNVEGTNGSLFSVVDNLSGVLMSVNNNAGLPVFEVNDDDSIVAGRFAQNDFVITSSGDIGMGIAAPSGKLHVVGEVHVDNLKLDGNTLSSTNTNGNVIIAPNGTGGIAAGSSATVTGSYAVVGGGGCNCACGTNSTVSGGRCNTASGNFSTVSGGGGGDGGNTASGFVSTVGGGRSNTASGYYSTVSGGYYNTASGRCSTVSGGGANTASGYYSTVSGGTSNCASGYFSTISGGGSNTACYSYSTVGGGASNTASDEVSTVGGGYFNTACRCSTVSGGFYNGACGICSTVGGGYGNDASGSSSTIGGGGWNTASGYYSTVGGGYYNKACARNSSVSGGRQNFVNARHGSINGGHYNIIQSPTNECGARGATIGGGVGHNTSGGTVNIFSGDITGVVTCCNAGRFSTISGGLRNIATGLVSTVSGGCCNTASGYYSTIGGGCCNTANMNNTVIVGGRQNTASARYSTILGGFRAKTTKMGEVAHAMGYFSQPGDSQHSIFVVSISTSNTTSTEMFIDGNITAYPDDRMTIPAETTWTFDIKLTAYNDTDNTAAWWIFRGGIRRNAANGTALIGSLIEERDYEGTMSGTSAAVTADDTNESLKIAVTGLASKNIRWYAVVDVAQVSWGTP